MTDNAEKIKCPACNKLMHKVFIEKMNANVDICLDGCGGIYFDSGELEQVDETHEDATEIFKLLEGRKFDSVDEFQIRMCPKCQVKMMKHQKCGLFLDTCNTCGSSFLDGGELDKYRDEYTSDEALKKLFSKLL